MITGILTTILFIIVCLRSVDKRLLKKRGVFTKIHIPMGIALVAVMAAHMAVTFPLFASRSILVLVMGLLALISILTAYFGIIKKKTQWHRIAAVCTVLFISLHILFNIMGIITYQNQVKNITITDVDLPKISDGVVAKHPLILCKSLAYSRYLSLPGKVQPTDRTESLRPKR